MNEFLTCQIKSSMASNHLGNQDDSNGKKKCVWLTENVQGEGGIKYWIKASAEWV